MRTKYRIKDNVGNNYLFDGKFFTIDQAQRLADRIARAETKKTGTCWLGVVCVVPTFISQKADEYIRIGMAGR